MEPVPADLIVDPEPLCQTALGAVHAANAVVVRCVFLCCPRQPINRRLPSQNGVTRAFNLLRMDVTVLGDEALATSLKEYEDMRSALATVPQAADAVLLPVYGSRSADGSSHDLLFDRGERVVELSNLPLGERLSIRVFRALIAAARLTTAANTRPRFVTAQLRCHITLKNRSSFNTLLVSSFQDGKRFAVLPVELAATQALQTASIAQTVFKVATGRSLERAVGPFSFQEADSSFQQYEAVFGGSRCALFRHRLSSSIMMSNAAASVTSWSRSSRVL